MDSGLTMESFLMSCRSVFALSATTFNPPYGEFGHGTGELVVYTHSALYQH